MKKPSEPQPAITNVILDLFRLGSLLLTAGDRLLVGLGLTSARLANSAAPSPMPNSRNRLRGLLATSSPIVKTCSGSSMTSSKKADLRSRDGTSGAVG
jgi:hypothetical protein